MDYEKVTEVVEMKHSYDINLYLKYGWKILGVYTDSCLLGWIGENPKYPNPYSDDDDLL